MTLWNLEMYRCNYNKTKNYWILKDFFLLFIFCNIMATWPRHVISLVILPNDILLSPPIALIYCLDGSPFWYTKPHSFIVGNWLFYIALLRSPQAAILFVGKHSLRHATAVSIPTYQYLVCWDSTFFLLDLLGFGSPHKVLQLMEAYRTKPA